MPEYTIEWAHKMCHPETCCHAGDFKILEDGQVVDFKDSLEEAEQMVEIFKDMDQRLENLKEE